MRHDVKTFGQRAEPAPTTRTTTAAAAAAAATPTNPPPRLYTMPAARLLARRPYSTLPPMSERLRSAMRLLPHPVVVVTAAGGHGLTLSTLTCLSLTPHALITFNVKTPSRTAERMRAAPFFVHVLAASPHAAYVANAFAQLAAADGKKLDPWALLRGTPDVHAPSGVPRLGRAEGVLVRWRCEQHAVVAVEDHEVWVGRVLEVEDLREPGDRDGDIGLMYANRRFRNVGDEIVAEFMKLGEAVRVAEEEQV